MQKNWSLATDPPQKFFDEHPELPQIVAKLLYNRGITTQEAIDEFFNADFIEDIHDPFLFKEMDKAVKRIMDSGEKKELITVHGDYDADGVSAAVILSSLFKTLGYNSDVFLPHRETDGYGVNMRTIELLKDRGTKLIITCDCGISNRNEIIHANTFGIDVIVTDHHSIPAELPPAYAIIHPKVKGEPYPDKNLAGGGVAFKLAQGILQTHAKTNDKLPNGETHGSFEKWLLDMVAIASVADMVPLLGESRTLTKYGLIVLNKTRRMGLQKLLLEARIRSEDGTQKRAITADTIGFQIAPRINAAGRMDHANVAYALLMAEEPESAAELAEQLAQNNESRQKLTEEIVADAVKQITKDQKDEPILFAIGDNWSLGIVGLIASRVKDKFQKPTIVMTRLRSDSIETTARQAPDGTISGSGRSIPGFDLIGAMQAMPHFFLKFGGHPMACGFTLKDPTQLEEFKSSLKAAFNEKTKNLDVTPTLIVDAKIELDDVNWELYDLLQKFEPFGQANEKPRYLATDLTVSKIEPVGNDGKHLRLMVRGKSAKVKKTIGWNLCSKNGRSENWCETLSIGDKVDIVFEIDVNEWNGNRELQLTIVDLKKAEQAA